MSVKMEVWGDYACWSRPELKTERYSYDVPTPSGARDWRPACLKASSGTPAFDMSSTGFM